MKRTLWCGALFLVVWAMLLPVIASVNNSVVHIPPGAPTLQADGSPLPPTPPLTTSSDGILMADGSPLPPTPPVLC